MPKPSKPKPINWVAVRAEYEAGGISLRQLADKLGINKRTLERRCSKESWVQGVGKVTAEVNAKVSAEIKSKAIAQRVKKKLTTLEIIESVIDSTYEAIQERPDYFKTSGEAIAALDRMIKLQLEYSDEHIQKWLLDKGYVAVPIAEFAPSSESSESSGTKIGAFADILRENPDPASPIATAN